MPEVHAGPKLIVAVVVDAVVTVDATVASPVTDHV
jgi:hypothetical protein